MNQEQENQVKRKSIFSHWILIGLSISLLLSVCLTMIYPYVVKNTGQNEFNAIETQQNLNWLYENTYLLYHDLYNKVNQSDVSYMELYLETEEELAWILEEDAIEHYQNSLWGTDEDDTSKESLERDVDVEELIQIMYGYRSYFEYVENNFQKLNEYYDYVIEDLESGEFVSNLPDTDIDPGKQKFYISLLFDGNGNASIETIHGEDENLIRREMNDILRSSQLTESVYQILDNDINIAKYVKEASYPAGCRIQYAISQTAWAQILQEGYSVSLLYGAYSVPSGESTNYYFASSFLANAVMLLVILVFLTAVILPVKCEEEAKPWKKLPALRLPLEVLFIAGIICFGAISLLLQLSYTAASGETYSGGFAVTGAAARLAVYILNILIYSGYLFLWYCFGIAAKALTDMGLKRYIRERCICYQIFPLCKRLLRFLKDKAAAIYNDINHFDVTRNAHKLILKIVLVNALVLFIIGSLWFSGFAIAAIYSVLLYFILRKYISDLQKKYGILLHATNEIAQGNLSVAIPEDLGVFEPFKPQIIRIQDGFKKAVEEETKSQRMKAELITNVSHDLKTPLTAIITYINLLKEEDITEEQRREYLDTLERKSLRLKVLIEDLFEVSKANSQNVTLNIMDVDLLNLVKQVAFETSDKMKEANLELRMNLPEEKWIFPLDSQKTYRIYENLFVNISKYALPGTRVYVDAVQEGDVYKITLKNITAQEIKVTPEELTDRFVRGDASRNTEGSGLGLAIAKSFLLLQDGSLEIEVDGDLFKVTTSWKLPQ